MPSKTITLTAKRQATLPAELCRELGLQPGDKLALERCEVNGTPAWIMRPVSEEKTSSWFGALRSYGSDKSHAMEDIRRSIGRKAGETTP
jgi:bifunctional DNA-binding transcriptional regulator/antitoxin component of YhaV-PrlF toxin-antitoxin module